MSENKDTGSSIGDATIQDVLKILLGTTVRSLISGVIAPPGSGKSTTLIVGIQQGLKKHFTTDIEKPALIRVFVVLPTVPATLNLYNYMSKKHPNIKFGYSAERDSQYDETCEIVYCTDGHMQNKMLGYFRDGKPISDISFCDVLVLDEAHRGSLNVETVFGSWGGAYDSLNPEGQRYSVPKLIFMSATLSVKEMGIERIPVVKVDYQPYPVAIEYHNKNYKVDDVELYTDTAKLLMHKHLTTPIKEIGEEILDHRKINYPGYDVWLVFCPGKVEVDNTVDEIQKIYKAEKERKPDIETLEVVPVYGKMGSNAYSMIFTPPEVGVRRVIVTTNIAEASITIEFVSGIFDTLTEKYATSTSSGSPCLTLGWISKSSANQRLGRTGRLCPGFCYRMKTQEEYSKLPEQRAPEAMRVPLHNVLIKIMNVGLDPMKIFRRRIDSKNLDSALATLVELGMVESYVNVEPNGTVTYRWRVKDMGQFAASLPLSVYASAILFHWCRQGNDIFTGIVLVSLIGGFDEGYFYYPNTGLKGKEQRLETEQYFKDHFRRFAGKTHLESLIIMWHHLMKHFGTLKPKTYLLKRWCFKNSFNGKKVKEALSTMISLCKIFHRERERSLRIKGASMIGEIKMVGFSPRHAIETIVPILEVVYKNKLCMRQDGAKMAYKCIRGHGIHYISNRNPMTEREADAKRIIAIKTNTSNIEGDTPVGPGGSMRVKEEYAKVFIGFYTPSPIHGYLPDSDEVDYKEEMEEPKTEVEEEEEDEEEDPENVNKDTFIIGDTFGETKRVTPSSRGRKGSSPGRRGGPSPGRKGSSPARRGGPSPGRGGRRGTSPRRGDRRAPSSPNRRGSPERQASPVPVSRRVGLVSPRRQASPGREVSPVSRPSRERRVSPVSRRPERREEPEYEPVVVETRPAGRSLTVKSVERRAPERKIYTEGPERPAGSRIFLEEAKSGPSRTIVPRVIETKTSSRDTSSRGRAASPSPSPVRIRREVSPRGRETSPPPVRNRVQESLSRGSQGSPPPVRNRGQESVSRTISRETPRPVTIRMPRREETPKPVTSRREVSTSPGGRPSSQRISRETSNSPPLQRRGSPEPVSRRSTPRRNEEPEPVAPRSKARSLVPN
jgi:hypothetical protein